MLQTFVYFPHALPPVFHAFAQTVRKHALIQICHKHGNWHEIRCTELRLQEYNDKMGMKETPSFSSSRESTGRHTCSSISLCKRGSGVALAVRNSPPSPRPVNHSLRVPTFIDKEVSCFEEEKRSSKKNPGKKFAGITRKVPRVEKEVRF